MGGMIRDWRAHAESSELAKLVEKLRPNELQVWLDSATPRLPETVRLNPSRNDSEWTKKQLLDMGAIPIEWFTGPGGAYQLPWEKSRCPDEKLKKKIQILHATGRITQQESASMMPVQALDIQPGHRVLDLCAAPGSKTTQIAEALNGEGLVVASEPNPGRANNLVSNVQRVGHLNIVVTREDGRHFPRVPEPGFDRILVDAPCTGTGTTRKNTDVWAKWKPHHGEQMARLQVSILSRGALLLKPGGRMVYSTCSIDPAENENVVESILNRFPWLSLAGIDRSQMFPGLTTRTGLTESTEECIRVWNDENNGSGFFIAIFQQCEEDQESARSTRAHPRNIAVEPVPMQPRPAHNKDLKLGDSDQLKLFEEWGIDSSGLSMWSRGHTVHLSTESIKEWLWLSPRLTSKHQLYPGKHWYPLRVLQAGQPVWTLRRGANRMVSKSLPSVGPRVTNYRIEIERSLLMQLLEGDEPGRSTLENQFQVIRDGGLILDCEGEMIPAWIGGRLSLMVSDSERDVLKWKME